jgi:hypothetical protein
MFLSSGQIVLNRRSQPMTPVPKLDAVTSRKAASSLKRLHQWLIENTLIESRHSEESYQEAFFLSLNPAKLSQSDVDSLNDYLFAESAQ